MAKQTSNIKKAERRLIMQALREGGQRIKGDDAVEKFIHQVLTESERITIGRRLLIANMLLGGFTRMEIDDVLNVSPNTITSIREWAEDTFQDYERAVAKVKDRSKKPSHKRERAKLFSYESLKQSYPAHFLLFTLTEIPLKKLTQRKK